MLYIKSNQSGYVHFVLACKSTRSGSAEIERNGAGTTHVRLSGLGGRTLTPSRQSSHGTLLPGDSGVADLDCDCVYIRNHNRLSA